MQLYTLHRGVASEPEQATFTWDGKLYVHAGGGMSDIKAFSAHPLGDDTFILQDVPVKRPHINEYALMRRLTDGVYLVRVIDEDDADKATRAAYCGKGDKTDPSSCRIKTRKALVAFARATARKRPNDGGLVIRLEDDAKAGDQSLAPMASRAQPSSDLAAAIRAGDRATLARAITLIESKRADHRKAAHLLVQDLLPATGKAVRLGITGAPGAGKSTTIDALGTFLTGEGHKVAVLAVDPSSTRTGGSILGDKTRMARLAMDPNAFVRPSPTSGTLGGVAAKTRETMLVCEAAGYDVIMVETVGIGQSETAVADMTDFFLVLDAAGRRRRIAGPEKGHRRTRRHDRGQQGRRRQYRARPHRRRRISRRLEHPQAAVGDLVAAGRHIFRAQRRRHRRIVGAK